jgi:hypothetical protein
MYVVEYVTIMNVQVNETTTTTAVENYGRPGDGLLSTSMCKGFALIIFVTWGTKRYQKAISLFRK